MPTRLQGSANDPPPWVCCHLTCDKQRPYPARARANCRQDPTVPTGTLGAAGVSVNDRCCDAGPGLVCPAAGLARYHPGSVVAGIGDQQIAGAVYCYSMREVDFLRWWRVRRRRRTWGGAGAGHGVDVPGGHRVAVIGAGRGCDYPDPVVCRCRRSPGCRRCRQLPGGSAEPGRIAGPPSPASPAKPPPAAP
jgi:hypothetical protein